MRSIIQYFFLGGLMLATGSCATDLTTPAGSAVSASAYNKAIGEQGKAYYCGSGVCDNPPSLVHAITPRYPRAALSEGRSGVASVTFDIEATGEISNLRLESASYPDFGDAALEAIGTWRYRPATLKGKPVKIGPVRQQIPFQPR